MGGSRSWWSAIVHPFGTFTMPHLVGQCNERITLPELNLTYWYWRLFVCLTSPVSWYSAAIPNFTIVEQYGSWMKRDYSPGRVIYPTLRLPIPCPQVKSHYQGQYPNALDMPPCLGPGLRESEMCAGIKRGDVALSKPTLEWGTPVW